MHEVVSKRSWFRLVLLAVISIAGMWLSLSHGMAQQAPGGSSCRRPSDDARFVELRDRMAAIQKRVREGKVALSAVQPELDAVRKELAAMLARPPCPIQTKSGGKGPSDGGSADTGMRLEYCWLIDCDCNNVKAGLLTGPWRKQCLQRETEMKEMCAGSHYVSKMCDATTSGPNAFPR